LGSWGCHTNGRHPIPHLIEEKPAMFSNRDGNLLTNSKDQEDT
jgi:hypothetical protein